MTVEVVASGGFSSFVSLGASVGSGVASVASSLVSLGASVGSSVFPDESLSLLSLEGSVGSGGVAPMVKVAVISSAVGSAGDKVVTMLTGTLVSSVVPGTVTAMKFDTLGERVKVDSPSVPLRVDSWCKMTVVVVGSAGGRVEVDPVSLLLDARVGRTVTVVVTTLTGDFTVV